MEFVVVFMILAVVNRNNKHLRTALIALFLSPIAGLGMIIVRNMLGEWRYLLFSLFTAVLFAALAIFNRKKKQLFIVLAVAAALTILPAAIMVPKMARSFMGNGHYLLLTLFAAVVFLILTIAFRKKKQLCILFTVLTVASFTPAAKTAANLMYTAAADKIFTQIISQITKHGPQDSEADMKGTDADEDNRIN